MKTLADYARDVSIVISSCDAFFDAWRPFAFFFQRHWPDCPFRVYLITNELEVSSARIQSIRTGPDAGWATNMEKALARIDTPYLLYFQEDYFLTHDIDREQLARDIEMAMTQDLAALSFFDLSALEPQPPTPDERYIPIPRDSTGRTRLQVTLWQRAALRSILFRGETAWNMEARGSDRTRDLPISVYARTEDAPIQYLMSGIVRSMWTPEALALCRAHEFRITPHFRRALVQGKWARRRARALTRIGGRLALARQRGRPVLLD